MSPSACFHGSELCHLIQLEYWGGVLRVDSRIFPLSVFCAEGLLFHILGVAVPSGQECSTIGWEHILDGSPK